MNYKSFLENDILPIWVRISPDVENGGVFTGFSGDHAPKGDIKNVMCLGRSMWVFSTAYMYLSRKEEYLDICKRIFLFLKKCTMEDGKIPFSVTLDGTPHMVSKRTFYAEMYSAMGCCCYYKATKSAEVKEYSEMLLDYIYIKYMEQQDICQEEEEERTSKCFGVHMTALMMAQAVRGTGIRPDKVEEIARLAIRQMMESRFVDEERRCVYEHASLTEEKLNGHDAVCSCTGHVYEAAWFVMFEGLLRGDNDIKLFGKKLLDYALPCGFEEITEFIPTVIDVSKSIEENTESGRFDAFPQLEAIIACRLACHIFGDEKYLKLGERLEKSLHSYYDAFDGVFWCGVIQTVNGEYADVQPERGHYGSPFHLERYLLVSDILQKSESVLAFVNQKGNSDEYISS